MGSKKTDKIVKRARQTKIVATLGPSSDTEEVIEKLFLAGVDVFRLNFSHGTHSAHKNNVALIRKIEARHKRPIGILADMQGPKLRLGRFKDGAIELKKGMTLRLDLDDTPGDTRRITLPHPEIISAVSQGDTLMVDDGRVRLEITEKGDGFLSCTVIAGQKLSNNKGVNVPGVVLPIPALTDKDRKDLSVALGLGADWIAQSFVQKPEDVAEAKKLIGGKAGLIAKLEKPSAITYLDQIIDMADGIMLARGDLGVEVPPEDVPTIQKRVVRAVRNAGKPIIVATQMLESMVDNPQPTRAEASDVATAVYDGTDAVMLSAETAAGDYPLESVSIMDRICQRVEGDEFYHEIMDMEHPDPERNTSDAITAAAYQVARTIRAAAIANYTTSGSTTLRTARERPRAPILCLTEYESVARRLILSYGVHAVLAEDVTDFGTMVRRATRIAKEHGLAKSGQRLVITAGVPFGTPGSTNILRIAWVD